MRIFIFAPYLAPHVGGIESYVGELNEVLLRDHLVEKITVFTPRLPETAPDQEIWGPGYRIVRYPALELIPNFPMPRFWQRDFWRALRRAHLARHDLLVCHTRFFVSSALALACARVVRRPLLHVEHGSDFVQLGSHFSRLAARLYDFTIGRLVLRRADAVVSISKASAEFVRRLGGREPTVIYRGMWPHRLDAITPDAWLREHAQGRAVVTYVGRLIDGKGVADLVHAFSEVQRDGAILCLVGDGPRREELELLAAQLGVGDRVLFRGYLDEAEALAAILGSDVLVNPSYTEGLPTAVLEAAFLGRPVLATDVGGTSEVVVDGQTGLLVPPRDPAQLARQLDRLIGDPVLRERLGARARAEAQPRFSWERSAQRFMEVARGLVE